MNDLITRIVNAIIRQEGESPNARNPGNLRDCPWFQKDPHPRVAANVQRMYPADGSGTVEYVAYANGFWVPRSRAEGIAGAAHVVALHIAEGNSLRELISIWAPPSENNTEAYIKNVTEWAAIPDGKLALWNYILDPVVS